MMSSFSIFPERASTVAGQVDAIYIVLLALSLGIVALIVTLVVYFAVKYRRGSEADRSEPVHHSTKLELAWSLIPLGLSMVMFTWAATTYFHMMTPPTEGNLHIYVVAKQWMWKFQHPEGPMQINELHVPKGRPVRLTMISQDVIHSFFVPAFRVKMDVLPGRYTHTWFEATQTGEYHLFCAEYCGTLHSEMIGKVIVMEPAQYQRWLSERIAEPRVEPPDVPEPTEPMAAAGARLFQDLGCAACHFPDDTGVGPSLVGLYNQPVLLETDQTVIADENYIRESILEPNAKIKAGYPPIMPSFEGQVTEEEILQLIAYIRSLADEEEGTEE